MASMSAASELAGALGEEGGCIGVRGPAGSGRTTAARRGLAEWLGGAASASGSPSGGDGGAVPSPSELAPLSLLAGATAAEADKVLQRRARAAFAHAPACASAGGCRRALLVDDAERWLGPDCPGNLALAFADLVRQNTARDWQAGCPTAVVVVVGEGGRLHPLVAGCVQDWVETAVATPEERAEHWAAKISLLGSPPIAAALRVQVPDWNARCHGWSLSDITDVCQRVFSECLADGQTEDLEAVAARMARTVDVHEPLMFRSGDGAKCPWTVVPSHRVTTTWDAIGGLESTKQALQEMIVWPVLHKDKFDILGINPPGGVLLYGPPGTGKTLLASAVAHETRSNFMSVAISDIVKGYVGESEKAIAQVFAMARRAAPCVLFFDEFQAMFGDRETAGEVGRKMVSQFLVETDNRPPGLVLLASTNVPEAIDPALLRPGRFDRKIKVPLPDDEGRRVILDARRRHMACWAPEVATSTLVSSTEGWSGAELDSLCQRAALIALERGESALQPQHFLSALVDTMRFAD